MDLRCRLLLLLLWWWWRLLLLLAYFLGSSFSLLGHLLAQFSILKIKL